ncbi:MAG: hypothetical protein M3Z66_08435 [Chloroflexota bacterium]|nr:hypothetical protein [Chloroflexota bacterium]
MEVDTDKEPAEGEVFVFTTGGGFVVKGSTHDVAQKLGAEDWPIFELAESGATVIIRSSHVVALRGGSRNRRGAIGFVHRE